MPRLKDKVAIITGAAGGIGSTAVKRFLEEGAKVFLVDRDEGALRQVFDRLPKGVAQYAVADVTNETASLAFVDEAKRYFGRIDIALLNAGIEGEIGRIDALPVSAFDKVMAVNVRSVWLGLAAVMPAMRSGGGGSVVVTSSAAGLKGSAMMAAYSASKHAVVGLMRSAAIEGAPDGIRVNCVNPAQTRTRMMASIDEAMVAAGRVGGSTARIPLGRYAEPAEIVDMMLFLSSDESRFCTGSNYMVDGGTMA